MSNKKLFTASRWNDDPKAEVVGYEELTKEERIKHKEEFLELLVKDKVLTKQEAEKRLKDFIDEFK